MFVSTSVVEAVLSLHREYFDAQFIFISGHAGNELLENFMQK